MMQLVVTKKSFHMYLTDFVQNLKCHSRLKSKQHLKISREIWWFILSRYEWYFTKYPKLCNFSFVSKYSKKKYNQQMLRLAELREEKNVGKQGKEEK